MNWRIHHKAETQSTNLDARGGSHGDVFTADYQTAGRGRLDHKWLSPPGENLMMSVVLSVADLAPDHVSTLPLAIGLAVSKALKSLPVPCPPPPLFSTFSLKWPNDILVDGKKIAGILCERKGDRVIVGIGVNVNQMEFSPEIAEKATSLAIINGFSGARPQIMLQILTKIDEIYTEWKTGFSAVYPEIQKIDYLRDRTISVRQTEDDLNPIAGVSNGIMPDGSLDVGGRRVYAGEAHVEKL